MEDSDSKICKINDLRLSGYVNRTRSGMTQVFYMGNDSRDFDRYSREGGNSSHGVKMHDKSDTIRVIPPKKSYYSELIDGEWWWLEGCAECNGRPRDWMTYIECDTHNVCVDCKKSRKEIGKETAWAGKHGWQCDTCRKIEHEAEKKKALAAMPEEYRAWEFHGKYEITCPYCAFEFSDSWESAHADCESKECERCDNTFTFTAVHTLTFDCDR